MAIDFHYVPPVGPITGIEVLEQTERAINELGYQIEEIKIDVSNALEIANNALDTANKANQTAQDALSVANEAKDIATAAQEIAIEARDIANAASEKADNAYDIATNAAAVAADAKATANAAQETATNALNTAQSALTTAQAAIVAAQNAEKAVAEATEAALEAKAAADKAQETAEEAIRIANDAASEAGNAVQRPGDTMTGLLGWNIAGKTSVRRTPIDFRLGDGSGDGVAIQAGGLTVLGGGEFATSFFDNGEMAARGMTPASEAAVVGADTHVFFYSGFQNQTNAHTLIFDSGGNLRPIINNTLHIGSPNYRMGYSYFQTLNSVAAPGAVTALALGGNTAACQITMNAVRPDGTRSNNGYIQTLSEKTNATAGVTTDPSIAIRPGGNLFAGGGESSTNVRQVMVLANAPLPVGWSTAISAAGILGDDSEQTCIGSDQNIYFFSACNTIANSKCWVMNTSGHLLPGRDNYQNIGSANDRFANIYGQLIGGASYVRPVVFTSGGNLNTITLPNGIEFGTHAARTEAQASSVTNQPSGASGPFVMYTETLRYASTTSYIQKQTIQYSATKNTYIRYNTNGTFTGWVAFSDIATASTLGNIRIGDGFSITSAGVLSIDPTSFSEELYEEFISRLRLQNWLTTNTNFYVRTDGNDSNNGLSNTPSGAFRTLQGAVNSLSENWNLNRYRAVVNVAAGTYTGTVTLPKYTSGTGGIWIVGAGKGQTVFIVNDNTLINAVSAAGTYIFQNLTMRVNSLTASTEASWNILVAPIGVEYRLYNVEFVLNENVSHPLMHALYATGGTIVFYENNNVAVNGLASGTGITALSAASGRINIYYNVTVSGRCNIFCSVSNSGFFERSTINSDAMFVGSIVGKKYNVVWNGVCRTGNLTGNNYFPGTIDGTDDYGGQVSK